MKLPTYVTSYIDFISLYSFLYQKNITFQIADKLADLVSRLTRNTFEFCLHLPQGINVAKKCVNVVK